MTPHYLPYRYFGGNFKKLGDGFWSPTLGSKDPSILNIPLGDDVEIITPGVFSRYSFKGQADGVSAAIVSNTLSVSAGDFITLVGTYSDNGNSTAWTITSDGDAITWTLVTQTNAAGNCKQVLWTGTAGANPPTSITVTSTAGGSVTASKSLLVGAHSNYDPANPLPSGNIFIGASGTDVSQSITPSGSGSSLVMVAADWQALDTFAPVANNTLAEKYDEDGQMTVAFLRPTVQPRPDAAAFTLGETDTGGTVAWIAFEVKAKPAGGVIRLTSVVTRIGAKANISTFSKSSGAANSDLSNLKINSASLKSLGVGATLIKSPVRLFSSPAKLTSYVVSTMLEPFTSFVGIRIGLGAVLEKAALRSQVLFTKRGAGNVLQAEPVTTQVSSIKSSSGSTLTAALMKFVNQASAAGSTVIATALTRLHIRTSANVIKTGIVTTAQRANIRETVSGIKQGVSTILERVTARNSDTGVKVTITTAVTRAPVRNQVAVNRISNSSLSTLLSLKGQLLSNKVGISPVITLLKTGGNNSAGKVTIVIVSSAAQAVHLRQAVTGAKIVEIGVLQQVPLNTLTGTQKQAVASCLQALGLGFTTGANNLAGVAVVDPCAGTSMADPSLAIVNRLEGELPSFILCGGRDRFEFEETTAYSQLKKRGLI